MNKRIPVTQRSWYVKWYSKLSPQEKAIEDRLRGNKTIESKPKKDNLIIIYTDGSVVKNPGRGGYGVVIKLKDEIIELSKGYEMTTNNRMELLGVIESVEYLKDCGQLVGDFDIHIYSDSRYVTDCVNLRRLNKWSKIEFKGVKNPDLMKKFSRLVEMYNPSLHWVKGHSGNINNERCDKLAYAAATGKELHRDHYYADSLLEKQCDKFRNKLRELGEVWEIPNKVAISYMRNNEIFIDAVHAFIRNNTLK